MKIFTSDVNDERDRFNTRVTDIRRGSEMAFGRLSGRWKIVKWNRINNPKFATKVAEAAAALHNICQLRTTVYDEGWEAETGVETDRRVGMQRALRDARRLANRPIANPAATAAMREAETAREALVAYAKVNARQPGV
jgi:hypothetical protein